MWKLVFYIIFLVSLALSACARFDPSVRKSNAEDFADQNGFSIGQISAGKFTIWSAHKGLNGMTERVIVYIEGDGLAYKRRYRPSNDPTPVDYYGLNLAVRDQAKSVIYLARPCQFLSEQQLQDCEQKYWTSHRYSQEVIAAYEEILDELKQRTVANRFILVGYSGGGNIAAHLAARSKDISRLVTIAANLDLHTWTDHHQLAPMRYSLNPAADMRLSTVKQIHFVGAKDNNVPPVVGQQYLEKLGNPENAELIIKSDFDHRCCWIEQWQGSETLFGD